MFIGNVDTAFAVIITSQEAVLYKFVLTRISGEPRTAISYRNLENWADLKEFLQNAYIEKRTLDSMRVNCSRPGKRRTKSWRTGSTKFRPWGRSFAKPHC